MDLNGQKHPYGTKREKTKIAFFPTKVDGSWIWFSKYIAIQEYRSFEYVYEELYKEGVVFDTYRTTTKIGWAWYTIDKKHTPETEGSVQNLYK